MGEEMRKFREKMGFSQKEMAIILDTGVSTYYQYEYNYRKPPLKVILKFLKFKNDPKDKDIIKFIEKVL